MDRHALACQLVLERFEAPAELLVGPAQGRLRLESEFAREVGHREQQVAQLFGCPFRAFAERGAELAHFLVDLVDDIFGLCPVEADRGHARADLISPEQGRQGAGQPRKHPLGLAGGVLFARFDLLPLFDDGLRCANRAAASVAAGQWAS